MTCIRTDMLDFPTAWEIQRRGGLTHHPRCSSVPGWHPMSGPGFLCDCDAVPNAWKLAVERSRVAATPTRDAELPACGSFHG
ncbi:protein of unknown function [Methylorubrum extorquens]|uniref:Uncharacterized protein n=1 Tax=Methylorubrum extorquens TaxID=408 RepID=A0A2N9ATI5_METEX|nr:protein of unknown function [Methylorubrum extorquens]